MKRYILMALGFVFFALGLVGVFIPVLPTTPFMLLAAFLFARSSSRMDAWIKSTRAWRAYGAPFKESGGICFKKKMHIICISYLVMGLSAYFVQRPLVWGILAAVAIFLAWLMFVRIPTVAEDGVAGFMAPEIEVEAAEEALREHAENSQKQAPPFGTYALRETTRHRARLADYESVFPRSVNRFQGAFRNDVYPYRQ